MPCELAAIRICGGCLRVSRLETEDDPLLFRTILAILLLPQPPDAAASVVHPRPHRRRLAPEQATKQHRMPGLRKQVPTAGMGGNRGCAGGPTTLLGGGLTPARRKAAGAAPPLPLFPLPVGGRAHQRAVPRAAPRDGQPRGLLLPVAVPLPGGGARGIAAPPRGVLQDARVAAPDVPAAPARGPAAWMGRNIQDSLLHMHMVVLREYTATH